MSRVQVLQPGKTYTPRLALVTGANTGIGLATAIGLAQRGYSVIIHGRRQHAIDAAVREVLSYQIRSSASVYGLLIDLQDLSATNDAAMRLRDTLPRLDLLILNAAIMGIPERRSGSSGHELQFTVNLLSHYILAAKLIPLMKQTEGGRIVTVSSIRHHTAPTDEPEPWNPRIYRPRPAYATSKAWQLALAFYLDAYLTGDGSGLRSVAAHPGWSATHITKTGPLAGGGTFKTRLHSKISMLLAQNPTRGAAAIIAAATGPLPSSDQIYLGPTGPKELWTLPISPIGPAKISPWVKSEINQSLVATTCAELCRTNLERSKPAANEAIHLASTL